jgi:hypothetical protein
MFSASVAFFSGRWRLTGESAATDGMICGTRLDEPRIPHFVGLTEKKEFIATQTMIQWIKTHFQKMV